MAIKKLPNIKVIDYMAHLLDSVSINTLRRRIHFLESCDLKIINYDNLDKLIGEILYGYAFYTKELEASPVFRIRKNIDGKLFHNIAELTYPQPQYIKTDGRVNKINESIFYCAQTEGIAMEEVHCQIGDIFTVSELVLTKKTLFLSEIGLPEYLKGGLLKDQTLLLENTIAGRNHFENKKTWKKI